MNVKSVGEYCLIDDGVVIGEGVRIGDFCKIQEGCVIGDNTLIKDYVRLAKNTIIGKNGMIDSFVKSSGQNRIGDNVTLRYDSIIARGVEIYDDVFISPQLMTENVSHRGEQIGGAKIGVDDWKHETKYRVFIGTNATLAAGITVVSGVIIGSKTNVRKDITEPGVYVGNPARKLR